MSRTLFTGLAYRFIANRLGPLRTMQLGALMLLVFVPAVYVPVFFTNSTMSQVAMYIAVSLRGWSQVLDSLWLSTETATSFIDNVAMFMLS